MTKHSVPSKSITNAQPCVAWLFEPAQKANQHDQIVNFPQKVDPDGNSRFACMK
jgi:hypothetical protein